MVVIRLVNAVFVFVISINYFLELVDFTDTKQMTGIEIDLSIFLSGSFVTKFTHIKKNT